MFIHVLIGILLRNSQKAQNMLFSKVNRYGYPKMANIQLRRARHPTLALKWYSINTKLPISRLHRYVYQHSMMTPEMEFVTK